MLIRITMIALVAQFTVAIAADGVPNFNIERGCHLDNIAAAGLAVGESMKNCVRDEKQARQRLSKQWSRFPAPSRASCTGQAAIGGTPSYVDLLTCLQMTQWAR